MTLVEARFPENPPAGMKFGLIMATKFLHHLKRHDRVRFLKWSMDVLEPGGMLAIMDTDLEYEILERSKQPEFGGKLTAGYQETLVDIEDGFTENLKNDVASTGFRITHFECREYHDETDAFSQNPGDNLSLKFSGLEIAAEKPES